MPKSLWDKVAEYCDNDVLATEAVFNARHADFVAREILADIAGLTVNDTTNTLTTRIIFGKERHPKLVYTDLATGEQDALTEVEPDILVSKNIINAFPGYEWTKGDDGRMHNMFRGTDLGLGGYVYAEPGMYWNVALLDVASLHPHSAVAMNYFGEYTKNFNDLMDVRIYVKHKEYDKAKKLFGGKLAKYLDDPAQAKALAQALKIAINSVYGLTSATFDNPFRNPKNANNIVALRGALFMRTLQDEVQQRGFTVAHIKTDSIKIPGATPEIIDFCMKFAEKYGYQFEHEATYEKMCLVNNAVYIAKYMNATDCKARYGYVPGDNEKEGGEWTATGTQFQVPYVFKTLFSHEDIVFNDLCETKSVSKGAILAYGLNSRHIYVDGQASTEDSLYKAALEELDNYKQVVEPALTIKAFDRRDAGENVDKLGFLLSTRILSTPHDIDRWMVCTKVKLPLDAVNSKEFTFGLTSKKLSRRFDSLTAVVSRLKDALNGLVGHVNEINETS